MKKVNDAYNKVRNELATVGLLADGVYLDEIELVVAALPSWNGVKGYVYENTRWYHRLAGFRDGVIYLPRNLPSEAYSTGETLTDIIRHEYAHSWHWLDPDFFELDWYMDTFGIHYDEGGITPAQLLEDKLSTDRAYQKKLSEARNEQQRERIHNQAFRNHFVSDYATSLSCEDFAETFMYYLRYRNSLDRFKKRRGVYKKLKAIEKAIRQASKRI